MPVKKPARDFEAERQWLLRLPPSPTTDLRQSEWERDPDVIAWRKRSGVQGTTIGVAQHPSSTKGSSPPPRRGS